MKNSSVVTVAMAAALMSFAANAAENLTSSPRNASANPSAVKTTPAKKIPTPIGEECPYLFGCDTAEADKAIDKTKTASIPKKDDGKKASDAPFDAIVAKYASAYGVPVTLAHAVIQVESNYRPDARGRAGEIGLMQIKPATARMMGYSGSAKGLFHPETNIKFGMKYLSKAHQLGGGKTCGTILKYNAGHGAKRMNKVSSAYCTKVKRLLAGA
jgi:soluble lytic murein transglycosylase-like protein